MLLVYIDMIEASIQIANAYSSGESGSVHTNRLELFQIIKGLIELDFCIDVCGNDDIQAQGYIETNEYDLIIGLGELFRWAVERKDAYSIIYMTENPYYVSLEREQERIDYFYQRHNKRNILTRTGKFFKKNDEELADAIICLGEKKYYEGLKKPIGRIYPSAFLNKKFDITKTHRKRNNFLIFGTDGFIHKGIDLVVDIFLKHPEWGLYICGFQVEKSIKEIMDINIQGTNIYDCGYIRVDSDEFLVLANKCNFILQPSCSEATSTAVLTGMRHGMIPVVMHGNGFDLMEEYCYYFEGFHLEEIEAKLKELCKLPEKELEDRSQMIYRYANRVFTLERFGEQFKEALHRTMRGETYEGGTCVL